MTIEKIDGRQEITAKTSPDEDSEIDVGDLTSTQGVYYIFEGDHTVDVELLSDPDDDDGIPIAAGYRGAVGPFRGSASGRPRFVQVDSGTETVSVLVVQAGTFKQGVDAAAVSKASRQLAGDTPTPATVAGVTRSHAGTQSLSNGSQSLASVQPKTAGSVSADQCDITIQNVGADSFWINGGASSATGLKVKPGQSVTYEHHTSADGDLQLYPDTSTGLTAEVSFRE